MNLTVDTIDIETSRARWPKDQPFRPALIKSRKQDKRKWVVLSAPVTPGEEPTWAYTEHDEYIRIPVFPYRLSSQADLALAFMLQLGLSCSSYLPDKIAELYIVTGAPVELLYNSESDGCAGMRAWVGFAIITE
jgi:hypothetical protein